MTDRRFSKQDGELVDERTLFEPKDKYGFVLGDITEGEYYRQGERYALGNIEVAAIRDGEFTIVEEDETSGEHDVEEEWFDAPEKYRAFIEHIDGYSTVVSIYFQDGTKICEWNKDHDVHYKNREGFLGYKVAEEVLIDCVTLREIVENPKGVL